MDSIGHARYGVSFPIAIEALSRAAAADPAFLELLAATARRYDSTASARRVGLLVDRLFGEEAAAPFWRLVGGNRTPVLLRSTGSTEGPVDPKWRVVVNMSTEPEAARA